MYHIPRSRSDNRERADRSRARNPTRIPRVRTQLPRNNNHPSREPSLLRLGNRSLFPLRTLSPPFPFPSRPDLNRNQKKIKKLNRPNIVHSTPVWSYPGRLPKSSDIRSTLPRSSGGNPRRSSGHAIPLSSSCIRPARALKHSSTLPPFPFPSRAGGPGSPHCRYRSGTCMLSCAPYSSSGGGQVGNPFWLLPPFPPFPPSPLLAYSMPMLPDTHGERAVPVVIQDCIRCIRI